MEKINWTEDFSVGHKQIDEQHLKIIELINKLIELHEMPFDKEEVQSIMSDLVKYGYEHLKYEEELLRENDYPEYRQHKHEHIQYINKVTKSMTNNSTIDETSLNEISTFLNDWWTRHILEEDMKYRLFLEEKGIH